MRRVGDLDDRNAVKLKLAVQPIEPLRIFLIRAVVADISEVTAVGASVDGGLIGAARLQIVEPHKTHVLGLRRVTDFR